MDHALTRRFLITTTPAAVVTGGFPVVAFAASAPGPIERLFAEHLRLEAVLDEVSTRTMELEELYEEPPRPRHTIMSEGGYRLIPTSPGKYYAVIDDSEKNVARLKSLIAKEFEPDNNPEIHYGHSSRARWAKKTLAELEAWQAEVCCRKDAVGLTEAEAAETRTVAAANTHRVAMFGVEATTFRELAFQAALFDDDWDQSQAERVLARLTELAGVVPHCQR